MGLLLYRTTAELNEVGVLNGVTNRGLKSSREVPKKFRKISEKFPKKFPNKFRTVQKKFRNHSKEVPEASKRSSRIFSTSASTAKKEMSEKFPEYFVYFSKSQLRYGNHEQRKNRGTSPEPFFLSQLGEVRKSGNFFSIFGNFFLDFSGTSFERLRNFFGNFSEILRNFSGTSWGTFLGHVGDPIQTLK